MIVNAFIQARMSSKRFPGKMLELFAGIPLIKRVYDRVREVSLVDTVLVATSTDPSDNLLCSFLDCENIPYIRGSLKNVFKRFQETLLHFPCDYFVRICGDSPWVNPKLIERYIVQLNETSPTLVTNVHPRTYPKGLSIEICKSDEFAVVDAETLSENEKEHVFTYFYDRWDPKKMMNNRLSYSLADLNLCIDYPEDIERLENYHRATAGFNVEQITS